VFDDFTYFHETLSPKGDGRFFSLLTKICVEHFEVGVPSLRVHTSFDASYDIA
jgi:hypothetical protein